MFLSNPVTRRAALLRPALRTFAIEQNKGKENSQEMLFIHNHDTPKPAVNRNYIRLYGHAMCPYAERVRLEFAARAVPYQRCEVNLRDKAHWHMEINGGLVPILELTDGTILLDSKILMDYIDEAFPKRGYSTLPHEALKRAQMRMSVVHPEQFFASWVTIIGKRDKFAEEDMKLFNAKLDQLDHLIEKLGHD